MKVLVRYIMATLLLLAVGCGSESDPSSGDAGETTETGTTTDDTGETTATDDTSDTGVRTREDTSDTGVLTREGTSDTSDTGDTSATGDTGDTSATGDTGGTSATGDTGAANIQYTGEIFIGDKAASADFLPAPGLCTTTEDESGCTFTECHMMGVPHTYYPAGDITITGLKGGDVTIPPGPTNEYLHQSPTPIMTGGENIQITVAGADVDSLTATLTGVGPVSFTKPTVGSPSWTVDTSTDLTFEWTGGMYGEATAWFRVDTTGAGYNDLIDVRCTAPVGDGTLTVPASVLEKLADANVIETGFFWFRVGTTAYVSNGNAEAYIRAEVQANSVGGNPTSTYVIYE